MQAQSKSWWPLAVAIVIAAAMICVTLIVLNLRVTYPFVDPASGKVLIDNTAYLHLLTSGCTPVVLPQGNFVSISCPLWVRP